MSDVIAPAAYPADSGARRSWLRASARGALLRCPQCGRGEIFESYIRTRTVCRVCGLSLTGHRADDAPPYVTAMIAGHVVVPLALATKQIFDWPLALQFAVWTPVIIALTALLLPVSKGALIGVQWANRMHGFSGAPGSDDSSI